MPDAQVNVPAVGRVDRRWVLAGGAAVAGIVAFAWWRRGSSPPVAAPGEGDVVSDDLAYSPDAYAGATLPGGAAYDPTDREDTTPMTNAEWSQRVVEVLGGLDFNPQFVAATIGKYLSGQQLTTAEALLVQTAKALVGPPPAGDLPIIKGPEPKPPTAGKPPTAKKGAIIGAHGTRLAANTTLLALAKRYASAPAHPDSVEATKRWILRMNPWLVARRLNRNTSVLKRGWIVIVPTRAK